MKLPVLSAAALAVALVATALPAFADPAQNGPWITGLSLTGDAKYPKPAHRPLGLRQPERPQGRAGAAQLDRWIRYVQPDPAAGRTGRRPRAGLPDADGALAQRLQLVLSANRRRASLIPPDISSVTFRINPKAKWQDGTAGHRRRTWCGRSKQEMKLNPNHPEILPGRQQGRGQRARPGDVHLHEQEQPRAAGHPRAD